MNHARGFQFLFSIYLGYRSRYTCVLQLWLVLTACLTRGRGTLTVGGLGSLNLLNLPLLRHWFMAIRLRGPGFKPRKGQKFENENFCFRRTPAVVKACQPCRVRPIKTPLYLNTYPIYYWAALVVYVKTHCIWTSFPNYKPTPPWELILVLQPTTKLSSI